MKTVVVLIGNSDDKLSQMSWSDFYNNVCGFLNGISKDMQFSGTSFGNEWFQNACFVIRVDESEIERIKDFLFSRKQIYRQDSIAILVGDTEFI